MVSSCILPYRLYVQDKAGILTNLGEIKNNLKKRKKKKSYNFSPNAVVKNEKPIERFN